MIAHELDYRPRPAFQTVVSWHSRLVEQNAKWLLSDSAASNLIVAATTPRGVAPALVDGPSWPIMLSHYGSATRWDDYLLLRRLDDPKLLQWGEPIEVEAALGEQINIPAPMHRTMVWAEVDASPSILGKAARIAYRLEPLLLERDTPDGRKVSAMPLGVASAGFLLSPVVETADDLAELHDSNRRSALITREQTIAARLTGAPASLYEDRVRIRLKTMGITPGIDAPGR